jgi:hypothetical protein
MPGALWRPDGAGVVVGHERYEGRPGVDRHDPLETYGADYRSLVFRLPSYKSHDRRGHPNSQPLACDASST